MQCSDIRPANSVVDEDISGELVAPDSLNIDLRASPDSLSSPSSTIAPLQRPHAPPRTSIPPVDSPNRFSPTSFSKRNDVLLVRRRGATSPLLLIHSFHHRPRSPRIPPLIFRRSSPPRRSSNERLHPRSIVHHQLSLRHPFSDETDSNPRTFLSLSDSKGSFCRAGDGGSAREIV